MRYLLIILSLFLMQYIYAGCSDLSYNDCLDWSDHCEWNKQTKKCQELSTEKNSFLSDTETSIEIYFRPEYKTIYFSNPNEYKTDDWSVNHPNWEPSKFSKTSTTFYGLYMALGVRKRFILSNKLNFLINIDVSPGLILGGNVNIGLLRSLPFKSSLETNLGYRFLTLPTNYSTVLHYVNLMDDLDEEIFEDIALYLSDIVLKLTFQKEFGNSKKTLQAIRLYIEYGFPTMSDSYPKPDDAGLNFYSSKPYISYGLSLKLLFDFNQFKKIKLSKKHLTGGQGVSSSNLLVPTPIQNIQTLLQLEGFFIIYPFNQTYSILLNNVRVENTNWRIQTP